MRTIRHGVALFAVILWLLPGHGSMAAQVPPTSTVVPSILHATPIPGDDTLRARIKVCLSTGDLACIVTQWMALKGTDKVPEWLSAFQKAFEPANRQAGNCVKVAKSIHEGLIKLGERPEYLRITLAGEYRKNLGFDEVVNGVFVKNYQVATNGYHVAVRLNGKIMDAYAGLAGLPEEEYLRRLVPYPGMQILTEITESL
jgi:hypothetical protein